MTVLRFDGFAGWYHHCGGASRRATDALFKHLRAGDVLEFDCDGVIYSTADATFKDTFKAILTGISTYNANIRRDNWQKVRAPLEKAQQGRDARGRARAEIAAKLIRLGYVNSEIAEIVGINVDQAMAIRKALQASAATLVELVEYAA